MADTDVMDMILALTGGDTNYTKELADPCAVIEHDELKHRMIWIGSVDETLVDTVTKWILRWNMEDSGKEPDDRKPIKLLIYSYGGDLRVTMQLMTIIQMSKTPVYGYNMGVAYSAGCFIFSACHKRFMIPNSTFLIHQGSSGQQGSYGEVQAANKQYKAEIDFLKDFMLAHTTFAPGTFTKKWKTEWYIDCKDAIDNGLADKVIETIDEVVS